MHILKAIATEEGFYEEHSRAQRNNNPGNLEWGAFARAHGADHIEVIPHGYHEAPRFAHFPSVELGKDALKSLLLSPAYDGLTVAQGMKRFAPPNENATSKYITNICELAGCEPDDLLSLVVRRSGEV